MFKKFLTISLAALCSVLLAGTVVAAEQENAATEELKTAFVETGIQRAGNFFSKSYGSASLMGEEDSDNHESGIAKLVEGLLERRDEIEFDDDDFVFELTDFNYDETGKFYNPWQLSNIYYELRYTYPELFYLDKLGRFSCSYYINDENNTYRIASMSPWYSMDHEETESAKAFFEKTTNQIAQYAMGDGHSDFEKALLIHDYIVLNYEYDTRVYSKDENIRNQAIYDAYNFIKEGRGVCESYSKLYKYILGLCGINCVYSESDDMNHIWNLVELDGKWYHTDLTWDDPTYNTPGYVRYDYFLVGDEDFASADIYGYGQIKDENGDTVDNLEDPNFHYGFINENGIICEETYADSFWGIKAVENSDGFTICESPIVFDKNNYYFISYNNTDRISAITARSKKDGTETNVVSYDDKWMVPGKNSFYIGNFSGLAMIDGVLIYNTPTEIRYVLPSGKHDTLIEQIETDNSHFDGDVYIYRFGASLDGKFYEHEPFYTHIETPEKDNNGKWYGQGKDRYRVEIDYYIAPAPSKAYMADEVDVDVRVDFDNIHHYDDDDEDHRGQSPIKKKEKKRTFLTKGRTEKTCSICNEVKIEETPAKFDDIDNDGESDHSEKLPEDSIINIIKGIMGIGEGEFDTTTDEGVANVDVDGDNAASLNDINGLFKYLREQYHLEKGTRITE